MGWLKIQKLEHREQRERNITFKQKNIKILICNSDGTF